MEYNAKCLKCGYIFDADEKVEKCTCPLCGEEISTKEAMDSFKEKFKEYFTEKRSTRKMILDLVVFGLSFCAFIIILYFIISFIVWFGK
ncbi:MAG: hypothetical protein J1E41_06880 [Ruminococcus sp.]|nr:hypothetical protein [Ruminococcus sp.]